MKVLTLDIETSPSIVYSFQRFKANIGLNQVIEDGRIICFAAKWEDDEEVLFFSEYHHTRETMLQAAWLLLDEADAVVTYNGDSFDLKWLMAEFAVEGMGRPAPFDSIDLYKVGKKHMRLESHKLDNLAQRFGLGEKVKHEGFELWRSCLVGDEAAWDRMQTYNSMDVSLTEDLYHYLLPWITGHPSVGLSIGDERVCPRCGSQELVKRGFYTTKTSKFQRYRCRDCGGWSRETTRVAKTQIVAI